jgi:hypothetical protein
MIDGVSGAVRWADGFELDRAVWRGTLVDVVGQLARSLSVQMHRASGDAAARLADHQVRADDLAMQGFNFVFRGLTPQNAEEAKQRFEAGCARTHVHSGPGPVSPRSPGRPAR